MSADPTSGQCGFAPRAVHTGAGVDRDSGFFRFSVGIEDADSITASLHQALEQAGLL